MTKRDIAIEKIVDHLGCSLAEATEIYEADKAIDSTKNDNPIFDWEMSKEEHKKAVKNANATERKAPPAYKFEKRERKKDQTKVELIAEMATKLAEMAENVEIIKPEREISFTIGENSYSFTLTQHRKPK